MSRSVHTPRSGSAARPIFSCAHALRRCSCPPITRRASWAYAISSSAAAPTFWCRTRASAGSSSKANLTEILPDGLRVTVGSGVKFDTLVDWAADHDLEGLAFAAGIAGSVGGAIYGNAGCYGREIGDLVVELTLMTPDGELKVADRAYCGFSYRHSRLKESGDIVLTVTLQLRNGGRGEAARRRPNEHRRHRADAPSHSRLFRRVFLQEHRGCRRTARQDRRGAASGADRRQGRDAREARPFTRGTPIS